MNYGRFFEFDFESSYLQKGIAVFNYRWLKRKDSGENKSPRYPIYLTFTPESFSFNLHLLKENKDNTANPWSHYHHTIIEIRLSSNVDVAKGLNESLNNAYDVQFPIKKNSNIRTVNKTVDYELLDIVEKSFDLQDCVVKGYSHLDCFEPETQKHYDLKETELVPHLLRKLILDFLYDYEFSNVFKNVAFYDELSARLKESFIFNALLNKARYYYFRTELCESEVLERCNNIESVDKSIDQGLAFFFEQYAKAEHEWMSSILDEKSMQLFHKSPWFEEAYQELEQVYYSKRSGKWKKYNKKEMTVPQGIPEIEDVPEISYSDYPDCDDDSENTNDRNTMAEAKARRRYLHRIGAEMDSFKLTVSNMLNLSRKGASKELKDKMEPVVKLHRDTVNEAAAWEIKHYHFFGLWKLWFGNFSSLIWSLLVLCPIVLTAIWIFLKMWKNSIIHDWSFLIITTTFIVSIVGLGKVIREHFRSTWGMGGMALLMPRLLAAVVTAWFTMSMSEDLFHHFSMDENWHWPTIITLSIITLLFVGNESKLLNPFDNFSSVILSSMVVFFVAYFYSFIVGELVYDFFGIQMINSLNTEIEKVRFDTSFRHKFVFHFSFFATFIGIFLQLILQGKSVTDSK